MCKVSFNIYICFVLFRSFEDDIVYGPRVEDRGRPKTKKAPGRAKAPVRRTLLEYSSDEGAIC